MNRVGHFIVTYLRSSWLYSQITSLSRYQSRVYSWARNVDDEITSSRDYFQFAPNFGVSKIGRLAMLGYSLVWERTVRGVSHRLATQMREDGVSVIHAHFGRAGYLGLPIAEATQLPLVTSFYGYDVSQYGKMPKWQQNYSTLFERGDLILCLGPNMQAALIALGCPREKTLIHHLGVDINNIEYHPRVWNPSEPLRVLIAATFRPKKGIPYALEALGQIRNEVKLEITIVGDSVNVPDSGPEKQKILETIRASGLKSCTELVGFKPYKYLLEEAYRQHLFLVPSVTADDGDTEGTPMVLADMAATGIPIISTHHADIPELILDGKTGLLAKERDVDGIVDHLRWAIRNPDQWEHMTRSGREHIEAEFDIYTQSERLSSIYDMLRQRHA